MYKELRLAGVALALTAVLGQARAARAQRIAIDSISGPVTAHEIDSFKQFMQTRSPGTTSWGGPGAHNAIADGAPGRDVEGLGLMFEATGDREILDRMIFFVDAFITMRNDPVTGRIIWTGRREPIWLPNPPDERTPGYAASEAADTVAHIAYAVKLIALDRRLWDLTVSGGDPNGFGATYLQRAKTYLGRCDQSMDEYFARWFVEAGTNLIREPKDNPMWDLVATNVVAINRQMMFEGAFQRLAEAHEALGDDPARVARYDAVARASIRECLDGMKNPYQVAGHTVYRWYYFPDRTHGIESTGHGNYDVLGVQRAFARAHVYGITREEVVPFADTITYVISRGNNTFSTSVDGTGGLQNYLAAEWLPVGDWNDSAYPLMATAAVASRASTTPHLAAAIFWMKQRRGSWPDAGAPPAPVPDAAVADARPSSDVPSGELDHDAAARPQSDAAAPSTPVTPRTNGCGCALGSAASNTGVTSATLPPTLLALLAAPFRLRRSRRATSSRFRFWGGSNAAVARTRGTRNRLGDSRNGSPGAVPSHLGRTSSSGDVGGEPGRIVALAAAADAQVQHRARHHLE
jgi:hypothetical protein